MHCQPISRARLLDQNCDKLTDVQTRRRRTPRDGGHRPPSTFGLRWPVSSRSLKNQDSKLTSTTAMTTEQTYKTRTQNRDRINILTVQQHSSINVMLMSRNRVNNGSYEETYDAKRIVVTRVCVSVCLSVCTSG